MARAELIGNGTSCRWQFAGALRLRLEVAENGIAVNSVDGSVVYSNEVTAIFRQGD